MANIWEYEVGYNEQLEYGLDLIKADILNDQQQVRIST